MPDLNPSFLKLLGHVAMGVAGAGVENQALLPDMDPHLKAINLGMGAVTGLRGGQKGWGKALGPLALKEMALLGLNTGKKYVDIQQPIAETNLETARLNQQAAATNAQRAQSMSPATIAQLGMAGAGLAGAAGMGYYLYNTIGPGKKKPKPQTTVRMNLPRGQGEVDVTGDNDTLSLSKTLTKALQRDAKKRLRQEAYAPPLLKAASLGITLDTPVETRLTNLLELL